MENKCEPLDPVRRGGLRSERKIEDALNLGLRTLDRHAVTESFRGLMKGRSKKLNEQCEAR